MLTHLHISNYALITHLDIDFGAGFSVMTGETGAGKSIILGALGLVMGGRADTKTITEGEERCIIEATFDQTDTTGQQHELIIRRELNTNGRSRSFVNDEVVTQAELKALAQQLIDVHSQHENLLLNDNSFQLGIVDSIAHNQQQREQYTTLYQQYRDIESRLAQLQELARKTKADADYIQYQYDQLESAHLIENEDEELSRQQYLLSHAADIKTALQTAVYHLDDGEQGAISHIRAIRLDGIDDSLAERLRSVEIELRDIVAEADHLADRTEYNPQLLAEVEERLDVLNTLMKKHNLNSVNELISLRDQLEAQCEQMGSFDEQIAELQQQLDQQRALLQTAAERLTESRKAVSQTIIQHLVSNLTRLGIAHAKMDIDYTTLADFTPSGKDEVQLLFAANLNQSLRRVAEVASGGEIARLMLCIKALIADTNALPTIIFDEIDTGVSGEVASQMGHIMQQMGSARQIITITHLPQIAAQGTAHYRVFKTDTELRTETHIEVLSNEQRVSEIATMLSGKQPTPAAMENAKQLLKINTICTI